MINKERYKLCSTLYCMYVMRKKVLHISCANLPIHMYMFVNKLRMLSVINWVDQFAALGRILNANLSEGAPAQGGTYGTSSRTELRLSMRVKGNRVGASGVGRRRRRRGGGRQLAACPFADLTCKCGRAFIALPLGWDPMHKSWLAC